MSQQITEKRQFVRIPSSRPVLMIFGKQNIYATMTDFSRHGIGFMAEASPKLHSKVEVHFDIPETEKQKGVHPFQFKAQVMHCIMTKHANHIGVRLELPSKEYMNLFDSLISA